MIRIGLQESLPSAHLNVVLVVQSKAVVDAGGEGDHVALSHLDSYPAVVLSPHVEVSTACVQGAYRPL